MKVLLAIDESVASKAAATLVEKIGRSKDLKLSVVSVVETDPLLPEAYSIQAEVLKEGSVAAWKLVDRVSERLQAAGFEAKADVLKGRPGPALVNAVEAGKHDLMVVGAGRHSWLGNTLLGSVSTHVLHMSPSSVLVVHEPPAERERLRVLLAYDGSGGSRYSAKLLGELADPQLCRVTVLSVAQIPYGVAYGYPYAAMAGASALVEELMESARRNASEASERLKMSGFDVEEVVVEGSPHHLVLDEAQKGGHDLAVVGSRGHGALLRTVLGSVSDAVARHARAALVGRS